MTPPRPRGFRFTIRNKLLLASLSLLVIPWLGYRYILDLENHLRHQQQQALLNHAAILATLLQDDIRPLPGPVTPAPNAHGHNYVRALRSPIQLDGYGDDWIMYADRTQRLGETHLFYQTQPYNTADLDVHYRLGVYDNYLHIFMEVKDEQVIYQQTDTGGIPDIINSDHLRLSTTDGQGRLQRYRLATLSPGWIAAQRVQQQTRRSVVYDAEPRIKGEWQETSQGYNVELRIPVPMLGRRWALAVGDVDQPLGRELESLIGTAPTERPDTLGTLTFPATQIETLIRRLALPATRTWILDPAQRVLAAGGSLNLTGSPIAQSPPRSAFAQGMAVLYRWILKQPPVYIEDERAYASRFDDPVVSSALAGRPATYWRHIRHEDINVLTAAHPIESNGQIIGAVAVEQSSGSILIMQNRAFEVLINLSVLAWLLTGFVLLAFATRLSMRVRKLRNATDAAISADGKVRAALPAPRAGDELGDLSRSFANMLSRLAQYNRYLENVAARLAHELRTPIAIVRSSLDNMAHTPLDPESATYLNRAQDGLARLSNILTRMSEATRLEQTIQQEERQRLDIKQWLQHYTDGYRSAHRTPHLTLDHQPTGEDVLWIHAAPELLAQLMDKLLDNARDFHAAGTAVTIALKATPGQTRITVINLGPTLPDDMRENLLDSMVSLRTANSSIPHLGLGLYIARLIAEFHEGSLSLRNRQNNDGVEVEINLPRLQ